jgi:hypothetical protein
MDVLITFRWKGKDCKFRWMYGWTTVGRGYSNPLGLSHKLCRLFTSDMLCHITRVIVLTFLYLNVVALDGFFAVFSLVEMGS